MPIRVLVIALAIFLVFIIVRGQFKRYRKRMQAPKSEENIASIVKCDVCQVHVPKDKAVHRDGRFYCGEAHAQRGEKG